MCQTQFPKPISGKIAFITTVLMLGLTVGSDPLGFAHALQGPTGSPIRTLAPVALKGYGALSGEYHHVNDDTAQLTIQAENMAKARLVHAQFLSDLVRLPGVSTGTMQIDTRIIETREAQGQGMVVALREGTRVRIFTAPDPERLAMQLRAARMAPDAVSRAEVSAPFSKTTPATVTSKHVASGFGHLRRENRFVRLRTNVSNNGLYNIWTLRNRSPHTAQNVAIEFAAGNRPPFVIDARDGKYRELNGPLENVVLKPLETRVLLAPRRQLAQAPLLWFKLLRS